MFRIVILRARHVMITMGLMVTFLGNASASPNTLIVRNSRPVAEAIHELEKRYGWQITYEDPPYSHYSDLTDVTDTPWPGAPLQSLSQLQSLRACFKSIALIVRDGHPPRTRQAVANGDLNAGPRAMPVDAANPMIKQFISGTTTVQQDLSNGEHNQKGREGKNSQI